MQILLFMHKIEKNTTNNCHSPGPVVVFHCSRQLNPVLLRTPTFEAWTNRLDKSWACSGDIQAVAVGLDKEWIKLA